MQEEKSKENIVNKKRIAINSLMLYFRMFFSLAISLYTSRVVLQTLGVIDFGVYNVVGGVVVLFTLFQAPLSDTTTRFLTYALGGNNIDSLKQIFSSSIILLFIFGIIVTLLTETVGYWFVVNILQIPPERMAAAIVVLHSSVIVMLCSILIIPYRADMIAHERMDLFAILSIFESLARLAVVLMLKELGTDKLITYAILLSVVQMVVLLLYILFCVKNFVESRSLRYYNHNVVKELFSFMGWTMTGGITGICNSQGLNMLLNVYFGPVVNSARGLAVQVQSALSMFCKNIQESVNPQITKTYAVHDYENMHNLMTASSKFSYIMMLILALPIFYQTDYVLKLWLGEYPEYAKEFVRFTIVLSLIEILANPLIVSNHATGNIKKFQIVVESISLMALPLSLVLLNFIRKAESIYYILIIVAIFAQSARIAIVLPNIKMSFRYYFSHVISPVVKITLFSFVLCFFLKHYIEVRNFIFLCLYSVMVLFIIVLSTYIVGVNNKERAMLKQILSRLLIKILHIK